MAFWWLDYPDAGPAFLVLNKQFGFCSQLLECLAIITFVGGSDPEQTEKSMQVMWQVVHPKLSSNVSIHVPATFPESV